ncbi:MAG: UPF0280 family protein [Desulfotignum sp.]|jgi:ApbE superfamily uncharacterized protein (UPF0280 family)|nr:UPF0280 family protein [Desulfotignum sp.]
MFEDRRIYRQQQRKKGLTSFEITVQETNLHIQADTDLSGQAIQAVRQCRDLIEGHIREHPAFAGSLVPIMVPDTVPGIIRDMAQAADAAQVGPMAAVAGAVAEYTGRHLLSFSSEVIVENGGDIFICSRSDTVLTIFAGSSPLSLTAGINVPRQDSAFGVCTSSGTFGHSTSFGKADAVMVMARSCMLADAAATGLANQVNTPDDISAVLEKGRHIPGITGLVIILGAQIGLWGRLKLVRL